MAEEMPLDPGRKIIDSHLHLWEIFPAPGTMVQPQRFFVPEAAEMIAASGHNVTYTVFLECGAMYRADGPEELRCLGETEFVRGQAAMSGSGRYGPAKIAHRIVGTANLLLGDKVRPVLEAHVEAGGGRFRGVRMSAAWREAGMFGFACNPALRGMLARDEFRDGARVLAEMGLSLDVWLFHPQLAELIALADALPDLSIVLDHIGTPDVAGRGEAAIGEWSALIGELARRPNVTIKLGGMGMDMDGVIGSSRRELSSEVLAAQWRPFAETCIAAFTPKRCMFESNFPPDNASASYGATWNAFLRIAEGCSESEKDDLFRRTAARTYQIELED